MKRFLRKGLVITMIVCAVLCIAYLLTIGLFLWISTWDNSADFHKYRQAFTTVKDYVASSYEGNEVVLSISGPLEGTKGIYDLHDFKKGYLNCPENVAKALETIGHHAFPQGAGFETISVDGNRIDFNIMNDSYALVYSPDGPPTYLHRPDEAFGILWLPLGSGWYHVARNPYS